MSQNKTCHAEDGTNFFCFPCQKLICGESLKEHSNHVSEDVQSLLQNTLERLPSLIDQGVSIIPDLKNQIEQIDTQTEKVEQDVSLLRKEIEIRYHLIETKLREYHQMICQEVDGFVENVKKSGDTKKEDIKNKIKLIEDAQRRYNADDICEICDALQIENNCMRLVDNIKQYPNIMKSTHTNVPELEFDVTEDDMTKMIGTMYGNIRFDLGSKKQISTDMKDKKQLKVHVETKLAFPALPVRSGHKVSGIIQTSVNDVIVGYSTNKVLHYYDRNAKRQKSRELPFYAQSMTTTITGEVIASESKGSRIMKIDGENVSMLFDASPYPTFGVLCSHNSKTIYVCCRSDNNGFVYVLSIDGKLAKIISQCTGGQRLFRKPYRIAESPSRCTLYVTDSGLKNVIAIDKYNVCIFRYNGGPESNNFIPVDVKFCDHDNTLLVSNWKGNSVHQLTEEGQFRSLVISQKDNILYPTMLLVDCLRRIWISHKEKISVVKYIVK
ncbi:uncharacterized protein LOC133197032 [Saccostrea echinata]|uniref:uncharacterized protein LOC133197032 n=1 Tax=Saccostrea echinata TaxID=191078 RepID=UPI002A7EE21E|nr:uncharacterized protein LOC133197032 [Saccostrea echinata]